MTITGNHLLCDCSRAISSSKCPRPILSPNTNRENTYYHCPSCNFDYVCSQAIKDITESDKFGYPTTDKKVCRKCDNKLEKRVWPE